MDWTPTSWWYTNLNGWRRHEALILGMYSHNASEIWDSVGLYWLQSEIGIRLSPQYIFTRTFTDLQCVIQAPVGGNFAPKVFRFSRVLSNVVPPCPPAVSFPPTSRGLDYPLTDLMRESSSLMHNIINIRFGPVQNCQLIMFMFFWFSPREKTTILRELCCLITCYYNVHAYKTKKYSVLYVLI